METRRRVYHLLEPEPDDTGVEKVVNIFIMVLIMGNVAALIAETVEPLYKQYQSLFYSFEAFSVLVFSVESSFGCGRQALFLNTRGSGDCCASRPLHSWLWISSRSLRSTFLSFLQTFSS